MARRLVAVGLVAFAATSGAVYAAARDGTVWSAGGDRVQISEPVGLAVLQSTAATLSVEGRRIVLHGKDGNYEFEHGAAVPVSQLLAVDASNRQTPLQFGLADSQNVTALLVQEDSAKTADLESWRENGAAVAGMSPRGGLRVNGITLLPTVDGRGAVSLVAILPDGSRQRLVAVAAP